MLELFTLRIDPQTQRALETEALRDDRTPRALARLLMKEGLAKRGYLVTEHGDDRRLAGQGAHDEEP